MRAPNHAHAGVNVQNHRVFFFAQEKKAASEIVAVSIGPKAARDTIRTALAMGADRGIHIMTDEAVRIDQGLEPLAVAGLLKKVSVAAVLLLLLLLVAVAVASAAAATFVRTQLSMCVTVCCLQPGGLEKFHCPLIRREDGVCTTETCIIIILSIEVYERHGCSCRTVLSPTR